MNELIPLQPQTINGNAVETVNARELHTFLESKQDFSTWIKNRIEKYEFVENADYLLHKFMEQTPSGAKHKIDYYPPRRKTTMSSREIATLCDKRHDNVMADIRKMLNELGLYAPDFSGTYTTEQGNQYECFNLPKRECLILVSGYNVKICIKIIVRWQQLEQAKDHACQLPTLKP